MRLNGRRLRAWLEAGGVIAYPTESCFGLGCDPRHARALLRVLRLKRRPAHKGLIVVGDRPERFGRLLAPGALNRIADPSVYWPGPFTLLLPRGPAAPYRLTGRHPKLAVRVPGLASTRELCRRAGMPLVSTSANLAGKVSIKTARECRRQFGGRVRVIDGRTGGRRKPSTIIDLDSGRQLR